MEIGGRCDLSSYGRNGLFSSDYFGCQLGSTKRGEDNKKRTIFTPVSIKIPPLVFSPNTMQGWFFFYLLFIYFQNDKKRRWNEEMGVLLFSFIDEFARFLKTVFRPTYQNQTRWSTFYFFFIHDGIFLLFCRYTVRLFLPSREWSASLTEVSRHPSPGRRQYQKAHPESRKSARSYFQSSSSDQEEPVGKRRTERKRER